MWQKDSSAAKKPLLEQADEKITVSHIYKLNCNDLKQLFNKQAGPEGALVALQILKDHQGHRGILQKVASDARTGIVGDEKDLKRRKKHFGVNTKPLADPPKLWDSIKQTLREPIWVVLAGSAVLAGIAEAIAEGWKNLGEAISIILMTVFLVTMTALADLIKDQKFITLQDLIKEEDVAVIRGKQGSTNSISVWDLVVGDVIILEAGSKIPADCLLLEASELEVGPSEEDGRPDQIIQKTPYAENMQCDPLLFAGQKILSGYGKALVCCVGEQSTRQTEDVDALGVNEDTPLQTKLHNLEQQFTLIALVSAAIIFVILMIRLSLDAFVFTKSDSDETLVDWKTFISKMISFINIAVVLVVVSVPDGLPITIGVSLAFSVSKMFKQKILVRKLEAPEKMGGIQEICCGKTGTLTSNNMKVAQFFCENRLIINNRKDTFMQCELQQDTLVKIQEAILYNCDARVQMSESVYKAVGDGTEVGLLNFLQDADIPIHLLINKKHGNILMRSPFSPETKRSAIAIQSPDRPGMVSIYVKGAPEILLNVCGKVAERAADQVVRTWEQEKLEINGHVEKMAKQALRVIGFAYIELTYEQWQQNFQGDGSQPLSQIFDDKVRTNEPFLTWLGAFALKDPLRAGVIESIKYARDDCMLSIRLISGDHIETAKAVALKCGIIREKENVANAVMDGETFRKIVGMPLISIVDAEGRQQPTDQLERMNEFRNVIRELKVLARATPLDKEILVRGLKAIGSTVGTTGEGIEDVGSLERADVGLAMGSGCSAAKQAADLILTDNDFEANINAIMWGRNIYHNVTRFLQYQVTVNFSCLFTVIIGGIIMTDSPFRATQLLWINLIMDTFAAIALSTEPPIKTVTTGAPIKCDQQLMTKAVWRQVIGMSIWNTIVMAILFASMVMSADYDASVAIDFEDNDYPEESQAALFKRQQLTQIYNTFMFLQIFNFINCRKVGSKDFNVFENFFHNPYFLLIFFGSFVFQIWSNRSGFVHHILGVEPVESKQEWGTSIVIGSTALLAAVGLKLIPASQVDKYGAGMGSLVNEDRETKSQILNSYAAANQMKIPSIPGSFEQLDDNKDEAQKQQMDDADDDFPTHN